MFSNPLNKKKKKCLAGMPKPKQIRSNTVLALAKLETSKTKRIPVKEMEARSLKDEGNRSCIKKTTVTALNKN